MDNNNCYYDTSFYYTEFDAALMHLYLDDQLQLLHEEWISRKKLMDPSAMNYSRFTSFLEVDNSYFCSWNWNREEDTNKFDSNSQNKYMKLRSESLFSIDVSFLLELFQILVLMLEKFDNQMFV